MGWTWLLIILVFLFGIAIGLGIGYLRWRSKRFRNALKIVDDKLMNLEQKKNLLWEAMKR